LFIVLFGFGHCIPIAVAGSSAALVRRVLGYSRFQQGGMWFRRISGVAIACLGGYFVIKPFILI
jgi:cytochrome c-type biogenesis protein